MSVLNPRELKANAADALQQASHNPKTLVLIHTGVTLIASLLLMAVDSLLEEQIGSTGGLSGMDLRSILSTAQAALQVANAILLPFWNAGFLFAAMGLARRRETSVRSLLEGFRRFGPILRLQLLLGAVYFLIAMGSVYLASFLFMLTPWAAPLTQAMEAIMADSQLVADPDALSAALMAAAEEVMVPLMILVGIVFLAALIPAAYRFRLAQYAILDDARIGALAAMGFSGRMMKGNFLRFVKLDVSFWWYYLLSALASAVCYGDLLLPALGVDLPWSNGVRVLLAVILYAACLLALHWWKKCDVEVTYAAAYDSLKGLWQSKFQSAPTSSI